MFDYVHIIRLAHLFFQIRGRKRRIVCILVNVPIRTADFVQRNNFSFKCHRRDQNAATKDQSLVYAVNDISFHPVHGTFSTCGTRALPDDAIAY